jgi:hypothetical protein
MEKILSEQFEDYTWETDSLNEYWHIRMLWDGIFANIVCYDSEGEGLTRRLISLMKTIALRNKVGKLEKIYSPTLLEGATIEMVKTKDYTGEYVALGGSLIQGKKTLIIAEGANGVLLGMY